MTRLYVFDLDGTLVDSLHDLADSANDLLAECGAAPLSIDAIGRMVGEGAATLVARFFREAGIERPPDALDRFLAIYDRRLLNHTREYPGISETLTTLKAHGPLAVLTNKPLEATRRVLDGLKLARFFDAAAVIGGDGALKRKPDPAGLLFLCARVQCAPADAMLVGDSFVDWETARNAGTRICLARYGFGFREFPREKLTGRERLIDAPAELANVELRTSN
ncbi:MAG TPA: HAD-IA family hydrolase [Vicinamibacterales bacterium]|nr:HAD-IA family hydrolase [Vicinamibacterales bacterium]